MAQYLHTVRQVRARPSRLQAAPSATLTGASFLAPSHTFMAKLPSVATTVTRYADACLVLAACWSPGEHKHLQTCLQVHISYLEIYNEAGYDLLDPGREVAKLEDLPRVSVLEDDEGTVHLRNLSVHRSANEEEALTLVRLVKETTSQQCCSHACLLNRLVLP